MPFKEGGNGGLTGGDKNARDYRRAPPPHEEAPHRSPAAERLSRACAHPLSQPSCQPPLVTAILLNDMRGKLRRHARLSTSPQSYGLDKHLNTALLLCCVTCSDDRRLASTGIHLAEWDEVYAAFGTTPHRRRLLDGFRRAINALKSAGCKKAYLDGSFVTSKNKPGDFDGCWDETDVDPALLDPILLTFTNGRIAQKIKFGGELFPAGFVADPTTGSLSMTSSRSTRKQAMRRELLLLTSKGYSHD